MAIYRQVGNHTEMDIDAGDDGSVSVAFFLGAVALGQDYSRTLLR
jgi:hypothetical protein